MTIKSSSSSSSSENHVRQGEQKATTENSSHTLEIATTPKRHEDSDGFIHKQAAVSKTTSSNTNLLAKTSLPKPPTTSRKILPAPNNIKSKKEPSSSKFATKFVSHALARKMAEKAISYPNAGNESDGGSVLSSDSDNGGNLDKIWCDSIHECFPISKAMFQAGTKVPLPDIDSSKQLSLLSGKTKEAQEVINSISHQAAGGTWKMGDYVADILTSAITGKSGSSPGSYLHSLPLDTVKIDTLTYIKEQVQFMQKLGLPLSLRMHITRSAG